MIIVFSFSASSEGDVAPKAEIDSKLLNFFLSFTHTHTHTHTLSPTTSNARALSLPLSLSLCFFFSFLLFCLLLTRTLRLPCAATSAEFKDGVIQLAKLLGYPTDQDPALLMRV